LKSLRSSDVDEHTLPTLVREGATIGAGCTIGNDLTIGRFAMVGMGSLVTKSVPDFHLVLGHPAASVGFVCRCGQLVSRWKSFGGAEVKSAELDCPACGLPYRVEGQQVIELRPPA
jgi:UDP-2-acetamido-3-amino-2,3-dideoxy-glucuronate N-acetyltransferase